MNYILVPTAIILFIIAFIVSICGIMIKDKDKERTANNVITIHDGTYKFIYNQCMYEGSIYEGKVEIKGITSK